MPAQWPLFINNFSAKLASRSFDKSDDIAIYVAEEYFNTVKTAQTPFGNIHQSGQKSILEEGFKKAFKQLYESSAPTLDSKMKDILFANMEEPLPEPDFNFSVDEELRACVKDMNTKDFLYYEFYPTSAKPLTKKIKGLLSKDIINKDKPEIFFEASGGQEPYKFNYKINNGSLETVISKSNNYTINPDISKPGSFTYNLVSIDDANGVKTFINQSVTLFVPENNVSEIIISETTENVLPIFKSVKEIGRDTETYIETLKLRNEAILDLLAKKVFLQNNNSKEYMFWLDRLKYGKSKTLGSNVAGRVKAWIKSGKKIENNLNKKIFQQEHDDDKQNVPDFLSKDLIVKFTYHPTIDDVKEAIHRAATLTSLVANKFVNDREKRKIPIWETEREEFRKIKIGCVDRKAEAFKNKDEKPNEEDPYELMAKAVLDYWKSCAAQPFAKAPAVMPTLIPTPGNYIPVYYGSQKSLSNNLRKAFNTGKQFEGDPTLQPATKLVATAVAVSFATHLLELKFIYVGQIFVGVSTAPMIGFVPLAF